MKLCAAKSISPTESLEKSIYRASCPTVAKALLKYRCLCWKPTSLRLPRHHICIHFIFFFSLHHTSTTFHQHFCLPLGNLNPFPPHRLQRAPTSRWFECQTASREEHDAAAAAAAIRHAFPFLLSTASTSCVFLSSFLSLALLLLLTLIFHRFPFSSPPAVLLPPFTISFQRPALWLVKRAGFYFACEKKGGKKIPGKSAVPSQSCNKSRDASCHLRRMTQIPSRLKQTRGCNVAAGARLDFSRAAENFSALPLPCLIIFRYFILL